MLSEHVENILQVMTLVARQELKINCMNRKLAKSHVDLFGYIAGVESFRVDHIKVHVTSATARPRNQTGLPTLLHIAAYYRRFIRSLSVFYTPLLAATSTKTSIVCKMATKDAFE